MYRYQLEAERDGNLGEPIVSKMYPERGLALDAGERHARDMAVDGVIVHLSIIDAIGNITKKRGRDVYR